MTTKTPHIPHIHLLCMEEKFSDAFNAARESHKLPDSVSIEIHDYALSQLPEHVKYDTIVSPANSYGRLDGAFDDAISRQFSPRDEYLALTRVAQAQLYKTWRGFAPPGTCTLVYIPEEFDARSRNVSGTRRVAICPTMRIPADVRWNKEVVYQCIWSLLCAIDNNNRDAAEDDKIKSVLMTPMATGAGAVSAERWACQTVLAMKHFVEACENPEKWSALTWADARRTSVETQLTWKK